MKTAILACKTLRHEIEKACEKHNIDYPIHWIESGLHNYPEKLHKYIQDELDNMQDYDRVIDVWALWEFPCRGRKQEFRAYNA